MENLKSPHKRHIHKPNDERMKTNILKPPEALTFSPKRTLDRNKFSIHKQLLAKMTSKANRKTCLENPISITGRK